MSNGVPMNQYLTPDQIEEINQAAMMAGIEDPDSRMKTFGGMQGFANALPAMNRIKERDNGRVVGRTSMMEGLGQMGSQLAGAYMNKQLMDKYGAIMDNNNAARMKTAEQLAIAAALRRKQPSATASSPVAQTFPVSAPKPPQTFPLDPYEVDGFYGN